MEIYVRNKDGFVLNSYQFNTPFPEGINNKTMYAGEDYTIYDIVDVPDDPEREYFFKNYYYRNGVLELKYDPEVFQIRKEIERLQLELFSTDYKVIKSYEATILGVSIEYDIKEVYSVRQGYRDRINELKNYLNVE